MRGGVNSRSAFISLYFIDGFKLVSIGLDGRILDILRVANCDMEMSGFCATIANASELAIVTSDFATNPECSCSRSCTVFEMPVLKVTFLFILLSTLSVFAEFLAFSNLLVIVRDEVDFVGINVEKAVEDAGTSFLYFNDSSKELRLDIGLICAGEATRVDYLVFGSKYTLLVR